LQALSSPVLSAVGERYYKVTAEALRVCGELVRVVRPNIQVRYLFFNFDVFQDFV
jgi:cullin-associated NEDD8-dissociated protein 1